nr:MAG TPA: THIOL DISULFIDE INTERCHANGE PROTEIN DSBG, DSBG, CHAPERONE, PERIPLASMIC, REDOX-ACTIVE.9A [Caudoviricetes sp.]
MDTIMEKILDPMSGARMFYFDKNNKYALFGGLFNGHNHGKNS